MKASKHLPVRGAAAAPSTPEPGLERRILAHGDGLMLVEHRARRGWAGARHRHPHDQLVYVVSGRLLFGCGQERFELTTGDSVLVPGGTEHEARALADSVVLDVFSPARKDYG